MIAFNKKIKKFWFPLGVGMRKDWGGYQLPLVPIILDSGWFPVTNGYQNFGLWMVTAYQWLPELWTQSGDRLPLVAIISDSGWSPVPTDYHNFGLRVVTGSHWLPEFWTQGGYRLPLFTINSDWGWLPVTSCYQVSPLCVRLLCFRR